MLKQRHFLILVFFIIFGINAAQSQYTPITPENASQVRLVDVLGRGYHSEIRWIGDKIYVDSESGTWEYDANVLTTYPHRIAPRTAPHDYCSAYSQDNNLAVRCASSGLQIRNTTSNDLIASIDTLYYDSYSMQFSADNRMFAFGRCGEKNQKFECLREEIVLWDIPDNRLLYTITHNMGEVQSLRFSHDSQLLISHGNAGLVVWDIEHGGIPLKIIPNASSFLLSDNDSTLFYAIGNDIHIWLVDQNLDGPVWRGHEHPIQILTLSPDNNLLASTDREYSFTQNNRYRNSQIRVWDVQTGQEIASFSHGNIVRKLIFSPSNELLVSIGEGMHMGNPLTDAVKIWHISSHKMMVEINNSLRRSIISAAFYETAEGFITNERRIALLYVDGAIRIVDAWYDRGDESFTSGFGGRPYEAKLNPDGSTVMTRHNDITRIWDIETGIQRFTLPGYAPAAFSADGKQIVIVQKNTLEFYDAHTGFFLSSMTHGLAGEKILNVAFHPSGKIVAVADWEWQTHLINLDTKEITTLELAGGKELQFSSDGSFLVLANWGNTYIYDLTSSSQVDIPAGDFLDLSKDNQLLALTVPQRNVMVWNLDMNNTQMIIGTPPHMEERGIGEAVFSPDGSLLVTSGTTIDFWNLNTGQLISTLGDIPIAKETLLFHPDGSRIITTNETPIGGADESYQLEVMGILAIPPK